MLTKQIAAAIFNSEYVRETLPASRTKIVPAALPYIAVTNYSSTRMRPILRPALTTACKGPLDEILFRFLYTCLRDYEYYAIGVEFLCRQIFHQHFACRMVLRQARSIFPVDAPYHSHRLRKCRIRPFASIAPGSFQDPRRLALLVLMNPLIIQRSRGKYVFRFDATLV